MKRIIVLAALVISMGLCFAGVLNYSSSSTATPSVPSVVDTTRMHFPVTVTVIPGSGDTITLYYSTSPFAATSGTAVWSVVGNVSSVSVTNTVTLPSPVTALKTTINSGSTNSTTEVAWSVQ